MDGDLMDYLRDREPLGFTPRPYYCPDGDTLTFYFRDEEAYSERVDELLTVYKSIENSELVGCKVKGVAGLIDRLKSFGICLHPEDEPFSLSLLFLSATNRQAANVDHYYQEMGQFTKDVKVPLHDLQLA